MVDEQDAPAKQSLETIGCDLARELYDNISKRELWLSIIMSALRNAGKVGGLKKVESLEAELSELRDNHLPKVKGALQRANKIGAECDRQIKALEASLTMAYEYLQRGEIPENPDHNCGDPDSLCDTECMVWSSYCRDLASIRSVLASTADMMKGVEVTDPQNLRAVHYREAFDLAIQCIEFGASNRNGGEEFLEALRKYASLMIQELQPDRSSVEEPEGKTINEHTRARRDGPLDRTLVTEGMAAKLWGWLDDIDTLDDACKSDDAAFRKQVYAIQQKRHALLLSDGYTLCRVDTGQQIDSEEQMAAVAEMLKKTPADPEDNTGGTPNL